MRNFLVHPLCLIVATTCLVATDPVWNTKPAAQWNEEDAQRVLAASPWAKEIKAAITRRPNEDQLREGGQMGQPRGIGNEGVDPKHREPNVRENDAALLPPPIRLKVRWENAFPVRLAELKSHEVEPPTLEGEGYRLAVYGIPNVNLKGDPKQLGEPLKNQAALKRDGKKDVRPLRVEVFQRIDDSVVVYLFPLSADITKQDRRIQFEARIGRIVISQNFDLTQMEFLGKLEL